MQAEAAADSRVASLALHGLAAQEPVDRLDAGSVVVRGALQEQVQALHHLQRNLSGHRGRWRHVIHEII